MDVFITSYRMQYGGTAVAPRCIDCRLDLATVVPPVYVLLRCQDCALEIAEYEDESGLYDKVV